MPKERLSPSSTSQTEMFVISTSKNEESSKGPALYTPTRPEVNISLNASTNINRRSFFRSLAGRASDIGSAGVASASVFVGVACANSLRSIILKEPGSETSVAELMKNNAQTTDFSIKHPNGAVIRVLGLYHTEPHYSLCRHILDPKVSQADIVLHEQGPFFERNFREPARAVGKISAPVEGIFTVLKGAIAASITLWVCAFKGIGQLKRGVHFLLTALRPDNQKRWDPEHRVKRRALFKDTLKIGTYLCLGVGLAERIADVTNNQHLILADVSPLTDGRSMKMFANALTWADKNPGKQIAVIVGDAHAHAMKYYASTPDGKVAFAIKNPLYDVVFLNCLDFTV
jgi:hypothetical protein